MRIRGAHVKFDSEQSLWTRSSSSARELLRREMEKKSEDEKMKSRFL